MYDIPLFDLNFDEKEEAAVIETMKSKWIPVCMSKHENGKPIVSGFP